MFIIVVYTCTFQCRCNGAVRVHASVTCPPSVLDVSHGSLVIIPCLFGSIGSPELQTLGSGVLFLGSIGRETTGRTGLEQRGSILRHSKKSLLTLNRTRENHESNSLLLHSDKDLKLFWLPLPQPAWKLQQQILCHHIVPTINSHGFNLKETHPPKAPS